MFSRLRIVYAFVRFLIERKVLGYELLERRIRVKLPDRLPRAIEPGDLIRLLSAIDKVRDRAMILLLLRTGMRIGELLNTMVHDVDLNNHRILIYEAKRPVSVGLPTTVKMHKRLSCRGFKSDTPSKNTFSMVAAAMHYLMNLPV